MPLPRRWRRHAKAAVLQVVALARAALTQARGWCANSPLARVRLAAENERLRSEVALLVEELRIKDARIAAIPPPRRPHYAPADRLAILALRAARGWPVAAVARRFLVTAQCISSWMRRLDEEGERALVRLPVPVNRYPELVRELVRQLRATLPTMGKVRIAQMLARVGLHLAPTTVRRLARERSKPPRAPDPSRVSRDREAAALGKARRVTSRHPHHLWHADLTIVPTALGCWVPWIPQAMLQCWPFCWWVGIVLDHYSRAVVATGVFSKQPTGQEVCWLLGRAVRRAGTPPRHLVTDQGPQFTDVYLAWCKRRGIRPRFGAVGKHGSIAVIERFIRSLKDEALRRLRLVPLSVAEMTAEVDAYACWYNTERPHQALEGDTPAERLTGQTPARQSRRIETRPRYPLPRGSPRRRCRRLTEPISLTVGHLRNRAHLPVATLSKAA